MHTGAIRQEHEDVEGGFANLGLRRRVVAELERVGFERPTPIQAAVIPRALEGCDIVGLAQTGSGKTAAFVLPLLHSVEPLGGVQAVILSPTREIALQTKAFLDLIAGGRGVKSKRRAVRGLGVRSVVLIGGVRIGPQISLLRTEPEIVVATPGRLLDHLERGTVSLSNVHELVLDEADHMLDLGFLPQIQRIMRALPKERRTLLFSATMPEPIERLASRYQQEPLRVDLTPKSVTASGIEHRLYLVDERDKQKCVLSLLHQEQGSTLVFARRRSDAEWLARVLEREGCEVERIHGDRTQSHRVQALEGFRAGHHRVLVATDIAARGLDIPIIEHIINYDVPQTVEDYVHRAGRTARGARGGIVSTIATWLDKGMVRSIERTLGKPIQRCEASGVEAWVERPKRSRRLGSPLRR